MDKEKKVHTNLDFFSNSNGSNLFQLCFLVDPRSERRYKHVQEQTVVALSAGFLGGNSVSEEPSHPPSEPNSVLALALVTAPAGFNVCEDKTVSCNICGKVYKQLGSMKSHMEKNHQGWVYYEMLHKGPCGSKHTYDMILSLYFIHKCIS